MKDAKVNFYECLRVVCLRAEFSFRRTLQGGDDLCDTECIAVLDLAVGVEGQRIYSKGTELLFDCLLSCL